MWLYLNVFNNTTVIIWRSVKTRCAGSALLGFYISNTNSYQQATRWYHRRKCLWVIPRFNTFILKPEVWVYPRHLRAGAPGWRGCFLKWLPTGFQDTLSDWLINTARFHFKCLRNIAQRTLCNTSDYYQQPHILQTDTHWSAARCAPVTQ